MHASNQLAWVCSILITISSVGVSVADEASPKTYFVQLIRASNEGSSPAPTATVVGEKLGKRLRPVFNWKNFWQVSSQRVQLKPGLKSRVRLSAQAEVEIDLAELGKRKVTAFRDGKPVARSICPVSDEMSIAGGDRDAESVWFIVVREDKPIAAN